MRNAGGVGDGIERRSFFGGAKDDIHDGRGFVGERYRAGLHLKLGDRARGGECVDALGGSLVATHQYVNRANRHDTRRATRLARAFVHVIRRAWILEH